MKRRRIALAIPALFACFLTVFGQSGSSRTREVKLNGHTFTLPVGFEIELVAGPPLVNRPITIDFDEQGRLYVSDSSGSNEKVTVQLEKKPHRIVRLEDADGDGKFDRSIVFADKMMFPEGTMWHQGSLYVAAPPSIWKLTDTDGDGVADQRVEWFKGKTLTGCANDLHGPYLGPDGWIYWCKGAFAPQTYERPGKQPLKTRAAHVFRARPDGTGVEPLMAGGMDNPVDLVFTPGGERIFTSTFIQNPGGGKRDGLIHAVYGGIYGKDYNVIYEHPWTGPSMMPPLTHLGAAAPCGLHRYESTVFGKEYQDNLFACLFNMRKVTRHILVPDGAGFKSKDEDFLVSDNFDFHPTDVLEDADGSLLVVDTGGWYKLCCPTAQLHKPDVLGAIYSVRKKGAKSPDDPRGQKLDWAKMTAVQMADLLDDPRPAVKKRAIEALARDYDAKTHQVLKNLVFRNSSSDEKRRNAVWAATRSTWPEAREVARQAMQERGASIKQAAIHSASVWRDRSALPELIRILHTGSLPNRRAAAEALGRIGDASAVHSLLEVAGRTDDRILEHSLVYALIEIDDLKTTAAGLKDSNALTRRAAMIALDQMDKGGLTPDSVTRELGSSAPAMKEAAWWIAGRHPEWGKELAGVLRDLAGSKTTPTDQDELARHLARLSSAPHIQELLARLLQAPGSSRLALKAIAQSNVKTAPPTWIAVLNPVLATDSEDVIREAIPAVRALRLDPKDGARVAGIAKTLLAIGNNQKLSAASRLPALAAIPGGPARVDAALFDFLLRHLDPELPVATRSQAADVLARSRLTADQLRALTKSFAVVGPMEADRLVEAFGQSSDPQVGAGLLAALKSSPVRGSLRSDTLKPRLAKFGPGVQKQAEELYALLNVDAGKQKAKLEGLVPLLKDGDIRRGQQVFNSAKAACSACHAIGYLGGNIGPDLTRIGGIRTERDLLESIVFPSASFVRSYEPVVVAMRDGKVHNGVIRKDAADEIVLGIGPNQEIRLTRNDIEDMQPSRISVMPAGLDQQLTPRDLVDLVAFLKACK
ncbi:MAG: c-type cytochrome [Planctomycetes bacterium]|nr:c-type cytochrome [Planctomycetota bacterium]